MAKIKKSPAQKTPAKKSVKPATQKSAGKAVPKASKKPAPKKAIASISLDKPPVLKKQMIKANARGSAQRVAFTQFGMEFMKNIFTVDRIKKELDKAFVRQIPISTKEANGSATITPCSVVHLSKEGRQDWERVFDVFVPFSMFLRVDLPLGQEKYQINGQVRMRLWLETYQPLVVFLNGFPVPKTEVSLIAQGVGNWLNFDVAKKFGLEDKLKESLAQQFTQEFAKSQQSRVIDILSMVK